MDTVAGARRRYPVNTASQTIRSTSTLSLLSIVALTFFGYIAIGLPLAVLPTYVDSSLGFGVIWAGIAVSTFAGLVLAASSNNMDTRIFNLTWIYDVILVVVLGGIGLSGGRGGVLNVVVGTLLIGTIVNGMTILNASFEVQNLIKGMVLLAALLLDSIVNPRNEETAQQGDI